MSFGNRSGPGPGFRGGGTFFVHGYDHGANSLEWAIFAILLAVLLLGIATLVAELSRSRGPRHAWRPAFAGRRIAVPESILATRYARGEITRDEFLSRLDDLRGGPRAAADDDAPTVEQPPS
jgi:uncharacterized membrane protein